MLCNLSPSEAERRAPCEDQDWRLCRLRGDQHQSQKELNWLLLIKLLKVMRHRPTYLTQASSTELSPLSAAQRRLHPSQGAQRPTSLTDKAAEGGFIRQN